MFTFEQITALQTEYKWTANQILDLIRADESTTSKKSKADKAPTTSKKSVSASKKPAAKTSKKSSGSSPEEKKEVEVPKLTADQLLNWSYFKKVRTNYCYAVLGCKVYKGKVTKPKGFVFDQTKWDEAKAKFNEVNVYVKKADR